MTIPRRFTLSSLGALVALLLSCAPALASGEFKLPDGRAWELVTPVNKLGASVALPGEEGGIDEASEVGNALAYAATSPPVSTAEGSRPFEVVQNIASRTSSGWQTQDIATPNTTLGGWTAGDNTEYKIFSDDLGSALVYPTSATLLSPLQQGNLERTIFSRDDETGAFTPLITAANVKPGAHFGGVYYRGASPDLKHVLFTSPEALTSEVAGPSNDESLYEASNGGLQLVSVLPDGHPASEPEPGEEAKYAELGGYKGHLVHNAVSANGSLVVWNARLEQLYLRDMATRTTVQLDAVQSGASGSGRPEPEFQGATGAAFGGSGPSRIYFLDQQQLTSGSQAEGHKRDLFVAEVVSESPLRVSLTDLTPGQVSEPADVRLNVLGYGENAAGVTVYYVADGAFAPGAKPGECTSFSGGCSLYFQQFSNASSLDSSLRDAVAGFG